MASPLRIIGLFLDPLVSIASLHGDTQPELLYLSCRSTKWKSSGRAKGHEITAVGWNHLNDSDATTGSILLGSSKGLLFESEFLADTDRIFQSSWEKCWRDVRTNIMLCLLTLTRCKLGLCIKTPLLLLGV
jgi:hypothetical protein